MPPPAEPSDGAPPQPPQPRLGGYRLVRVLGRGGLGEVYEALAADGSRVALKTFHLPEDEHGLAAEAFAREALLGQRLLHPGIVRVRDSGRAGEYVFLAMDYVHGHDLRRYTVRERLLPLPQLLHIGEQLAQALAAAHALGVVHRDLKPGNVLVDEATGAVKLSDFGLARLGEVFHSRTGVVAGTPAYMAPEQLAEGDVGTHSDLYALGVLLFELASGRLPFEAATLGQLLQQVARSTAPRLDALRPQIPGDFASLVAGLLEPRIERRRGDARAVAAQLRQLAQQQAATGSE